MGDISIIARRLNDGHVQFGWSGNGGYYSTVGQRLLSGYDTEDMVEYLFGLGQLSHLGFPGSEKGGYPFMMTHKMTGKPHFLGRSERDIFGKIAFVDYIYFYDLDGKWYYISPGPFCLKMPLKLIANHLDEDDLEFSFLKQINQRLASYILEDFYRENVDFQKHVSEYDMEKVKSEVYDTEFAAWELCHKFQGICDYFDDWVLVRTDEKEEQATGFVLKPNTGEHIETIEWNENTKKVETGTKELEEEAGEIEVAPRELEEKARKMEEAIRELEEKARKMEEATRELEEKTRELDEWNRKMEEENKKLDEWNQRMEDETRELKKIRRELEEKEKKLEAQIREQEMERTHLDE